MYKKVNIKILVSVSALIALEVILSRFLSIATPVVKIGFGFVPIAVCAMLYGPIWAGAAGALADFLGATLFPIGAYFPGFTLGVSCCCGCSPLSFAFSCAFSCAFSKDFRASSLGARAVSESMRGVLPDGLVFISFKAITPFFLLNKDKWAAQQKAIQPTWVPRDI